MSRREASLTPARARRSRDHFGTDSVRSKLPPIYIYIYILQQQRFHHPTLRTSVVLVGCIKKSNITSKHDHCCILVHVRKKSYLPGILYQVSAYLVSYCLLLRQQQRFEHPTLKQTSVLLGWVYSKQHHHQQACTLLYKQAYQQGAQPPWACS